MVHAARHPLISYVGTWWSRPHQSHWHLPLALAALVSLLPPATKSTRERGNVRRGTQAHFADLAFQSLVFLEIA